MVNRIGDSSFFRESGEVNKQYNDLAKLEAKIDALSKSIGYRFFGRGRDQVKGLRQERTDKLNALPLSDFKKLSTDKQEKIKAIVLTEFNRVKGRANQFSDRDAQVKYGKIALEHDRVYKAISKGDASAGPTLSIAKRNKNIAVKEGKNLIKVEKKEAAKAKGAEKKSQTVFAQLFGEKKVQIKTIADQDIAVSNIRGEVLSRGNRGLILTDANGGISLKKHGQYKRMGIENGKVKGQGSYGSVVAGVNKENKGTVFKLISLEKSGFDTREEKINSATKEAKLMHQMKGCKNVMSGEGFFLGDPSDMFGIKMEKMDGELTSLYGKNLPFKQKIQIARQVVAGLEQMHEKKVYNRDLKPGNILIKKSEDSSTYDVKIADFGLSCSFEDEAVGDILGTPGFMDTTLSKGQAYTAESDIYSLGGTLDFLFSEKPYPWSTLKQACEYYTGGRGDLHQEYEIWGVTPNVSRQVESLVNQCTSPSKAKRPSLQDIDRKLAELEKLC